MQNSTITKCSGICGIPATQPGVFSSESTTSESRFGSLRVLVVDDDRDLAETTQTLLEVIGIPAECAFSVEGALSVLDKDSRINVVLSDVMMPGLTGLDLAAMVKDREPPIGVVLVSGYTDVETAGASEYAQGFVAKPYKIEKVIELLLIAMPP